MAIFESKLLLFRATAIIYTGMVDEWILKGLAMPFIFGNKPAWRFEVKLITLELLVSLQHKVVFIFNVLCLQMARLEYETPW